MANSGLSIAARELAGVRELVMLVQLQEGAKTSEEIKADYERLGRDRVHPRAMYRILKGLMDANLVTEAGWDSLPHDPRNSLRKHYVLAPRGRMLLKGMRDELNKVRVQGGARRGR